MIKLDKQTFTSDYCKTHVGAMAQHESGSVSQGLGVTNISP